MIVVDMLKDLFARLFSDPEAAERFLEDPEAVLAEAGIDGDVADLADALPLAVAELPPEQAAAIIERCGPAETWTDQSLTQVLCRVVDPPPATTTWVDQVDEPVVTPPPVAPEEPVVDIEVPAADEAEPTPEPAPPTDEPVAETGADPVPPAEVDRPPVDQPPAEQPPVDQDPPVLVEPPSFEAPVDDPPVANEPPAAQDPPAEKPPVDEPPTEAPPVAHEPPVDKPPVDEPPVAHEPPVDEPPVAHEPPAHEPPAHEPPAHEPPAEEPPVIDEPPVAHEPPAEEPPVIDEPPVAHEPPAEEPPAEEPPIRRPPIEGDPFDDDPPAPPGEVLLPPDEPPVEFADFKETVQDAREAIADGDVASLLEALEKASPEDRAIIAESLRDELVVSGAAEDDPFVAALDETLAGADDAAGDETDAEADADADPVEAAEPPAADGLAPADEVDEEDDELDTGPDDIDVEAAADKLRELVDRGEIAEAGSLLDSLSPEQRAAVLEEARNDPERDPVSQRILDGVDADDDDFIAALEESRQDVRRQFEEQLAAEAAAAEEGAAEEAPTGDDASTADFPTKEPAVPLPPLDRDVELDQEGIDRKNGIDTEDPEGDLDATGVDPSELLEQDPGIPAVDVGGAPEQGEIGGKVGKEVSTDAPVDEPPTDDASIGAEALPDPDAPGIDGLPVAAPAIPATDAAPPVVAVPPSAPVASDAADLPVAPPPPDIPPVNGAPDADEPDFGAGVAPEFPGAESAVTAIDGERTGDSPGDGDPGLIGDGDPAFGAGGDGDPGGNGGVAGGEEFFGDDVLGDGGVIPLDPEGGDDTGSGFPDTSGIADATVGGEDFFGGEAGAPPADDGDNGLTPEQISELNDIQNEAADAIIDNFDD